LKASILLESLGIGADAPVNIDDLATRLDVTIERTRLDGARAQLVVRKRCARILVSERVVNAHEQRFAIAHELGHLLLDHPPVPATSLCAPAPARPDPRSRDVELEANCFAMGLLMPTGAVRVLRRTRALRGEEADHDLDLPSRTTVRTTELTARACASVWAQRGEVRGVAPPDHLGCLSGRSFIRAVARDDSGDNGSRMIVTPRGHGAAPSPLPATAWFEVEPGEPPVVEHTLAVGSETSITMLWIPDHDALRLCVFWSEARARCRSVSPRRAPVENSFDAGTDRTIQ
jgi:hypothetical protein